MRILLTGSSGMLGTELCAVLEPKHEVIGVDLAESQVISHRPRLFYKGNITDTEFISNVFEKEQPDIVIHAAAWTDVDGCEKDPQKADEANVKATRCLAEAAREQGIPVVLLSTDFVFDGDKKGPYTEKDKENPISVYGNSKFKAEKALKEILENSAIVRTSWLYGANGKNFVDTIITKAKTDKKLRVVGDQVGTPTCARDLSLALKYFVEKEEIKGKETYHVSNSGKCSWYAFAQEIIKIADIEDVEIEEITSAQLARPAKRPSFSVMDNSKFCYFTGHKMRSWQEALREYINSLKV